MLTIRQCFGDLCQWIAEEAAVQGLIEDSKVDHTIDASGADKVTPHGSVLLGTNAIFDTARSAEVHDWDSGYRSLRETIPDLVKSEADSLGMSGRTA